jgi:hypothetical protein
MVTLAQFQRVNELPGTTNATLGPSVLLTECGPDFSVVIASETLWNPLADHLSLQTPVHLQISSDGPATLRSTSDIEVMIEPGWSLWVAKETESGLPLLTPSVEPYLILFVSGEEHATLRSAVQYQNTDALFEFCRQRMAITPGFTSPDPKTLISPPQYACARDQGPWRFYF